MQRKGRFIENALRHIIKKNITFKNSQIVWYIYSPIKTYESRT